MDNGKPHTYKTVCFTGHRSIERHHVSRIAVTLDTILRSLIEHGVNEFYAGGAMGFDTIASLSVINLKKDFPDIKLNLVLPCKNQTKMWNDKDREIYNAILGHADSVEYVHEHYTSYCMHERNRRLVGLAEICVAYCEHSGGGSAYTMSYALKNELEVINIADFL